MAYQEQGYVAGLTAGREISAGTVQPGSKLSLLESDVVGPNDPVEKGDPCLAGGTIPAVCTTAPAAAGAICIVQTCGIWSLSVVATDDQGNDDIDVGDVIYITNATGVLSKDATAGHTPFGIALNAKAGSATASTICIKLLTT